MNEITKKQYLLFNKLVPSHNLILENMTSYMLFEIIGYLEFELQKLVISTNFTFLIIF